MIIEGKLKLGSSRAPEGPKGGDDDNGLKEGSNEDVGRGT